MIIFNAKIALEVNAQERLLFFQNEFNEKRVPILKIVENSNRPSCSSGGLLRVKLF